MEGAAPSAPGEQFYWDSDGNLDQDPTWDYSYDANNRLATMRRTNNSKFLRFTYDYLGRRVEKRVYNNGTGTGTPATDLKFVYRGTDVARERGDGRASRSARRVKSAGALRAAAKQLLAELSSSGALSKSFHWGLDRSDTRGGAGNVEGLLLLHDWNTDADYYPSYDLNGNVVGLLNESGTWAAWYAYDAFGNIESEGGSYKDDNPIRFSTKYTDEETGLVAFEFRYYDPQKGRFINRDPIGEAGGLNLYRFVGNDPANRWDYLGFVCWWTQTGYLDEDGVYNVVATKHCADDVGEPRESDERMQEGRVGG